MPHIAPKKADDIHGGGSTSSTLSKPAREPDLASLPIPETLLALGVNPETGLSGADVELRRKEHGWNEVAVQKGHPFRMFLGKFWGVSAWMLELIIVLSIILKKYSDLVVVGALLVLNAVLGFFQEYRAAGVVETLQKKLQVAARALRDSEWRIVPARDLVPGDIVRLRPGDIIPADLKLLSGELGIDQSALTGESMDADKSSGDVLSSGSIVRRGEGTGLVMLTGARTYFGRTTELVQKARPKLHIEAVISRVVRWLFLIVGSLVGLVIVLSAIRGASLLEMIPLLLVLLMSAVPVAPARDVHSQYGRRGEGIGQTRGACHEAQRIGGRGDDGCALRRQDRHDNDEQAGGDRRDSAWKRHGSRGADGGRARVERGQPGPPSISPFWRRRGSGASLKACLRRFPSPSPPSTRGIGGPRLWSSGTGSG